jgi:hypothetical protein
MSLRIGASDTVLPNRPLKVHPVWVMQDASPGMFHFMSGTATREAGT